MARVFIEGFESGDLTAWDPPSETSTTFIQSAGALDGKYFYRDGGTLGLHKSIPASNTYHIAFWTRTPANGTRDGVTLFNGSTPVAVLKKLTGYSGLWQLMLGSTSGTSVGFSTTPAYSDTILKMELYMYIHPTEGVLRLKYNGLTEINYLGNTVVSGLTTINKVHFAAVTDGASRGWGWDNIVIDDSNPIGFTRVQGIPVTGNGALNQFSPSTGTSNYACIEETPASTSDFVFTNTAGLVDVYSHGPLTGAIAQVKAVQVQNYAKNQSAFLGNKLASVVRTPDEVVSAAQPVMLTSTESAVIGVWSMNPSTLLPWTEAEVNGTQFGCKSSI